MDSIKEIQVKTVLLGESGVGKSCIILRYINGIFSSTHSSTILSTFSSKKIKFDENTLITLNIWDTAGQEKFRAITKINYQDAAVIILVFDLTNKTSFNVIKDYWYPQVKENAPENVILVLVAAKCDLENRYEVDLNEAENYAKEIDAIFKKTSALDNIGINELFQEIGKKILSYDNFNGRIVDRRTKSLENIEFENSLNISNNKNKRKTDQKNQKANKNKDGKCC
jgi:small GTP-binding protein